MGNSFPGPQQAREQVAAVGAAMFMPQMCVTVPGQEGTRKIHPALKLPGSKFNTKPNTAVALPCVPC